MNKDSKIFFKLSKDSKVFLKQLLNNIDNGNIINVEYNLDKKGYEKINIIRKIPKYEQNMKDYDEKLKYTIAEWESSQS